MQQQFINSVIIRGKQYQLANIHDYTLPTLRQILIRHQHFSSKHKASDLIIKWGIKKEGQFIEEQQQQFTEADDNILIRQFEQKHIKDPDNYENFYFRIDSKLATEKKQQQQAISIPVKTEVNKLNQQNQKLSRTQPRQKSSVKIEQDHKEKLENIQIPVLLKIIKKLFNHEKIQQLQQFMEKDGVPRSLIELVLTLSKIIQERQGYRQKNKDLSQQIQLLNQRVEKLNQNKTKIIELQATIQLLINQNEAYKSNNNQLLKQKQSLQIELQKSYNYSLLTTKIINNQTQFDYILSLLSQIKPVKFIKPHFCLQNLQGIKFQIFNYFLISISSIPNTLLVLGFDNFTLAIFNPNGIYNKKQFASIILQSKAFQNHQGFISQVRNQITHYYNFQEPERMTKLENYRILFQKQVFYLSFNLYHKSIELNQSTNHHNQEKYSQLYSVTSKSLLRTFEVYEIRFQQ